MKRTAFQLTPTETKILAMHRRGMTGKEISNALGRNATYLQGALSQATEKDRLRQLDERDRRHDNTSSLAKARGAVRMEGTR